jgi:hypothetical protein
MHNKASKGGNMNVGKWMWSVVAFVGFLMFSGCAMESTAEISGKVNNAQIEYSGDSAVVTGTIDGELRSINASEVVVDGIAITKENFAGAFKCYFCVCNDGICACKEIPCPQQQ